MKRLSLILLGLAMCACPSWAQSVEVNQQNKTIAVTAEASVSAPPEIAIAYFGYETYGRDQNEAFQKNLAVAEKISAAMKKAGVPDGSVQTETMSFRSVDADEDWTAGEKAERKFIATQTWRVRVPASEAQKLLDAVMAAGANRLTSVDWDVLDSAELDARASKAAIEKAKRIAQQMAEGLGVKLGALVYASNKAPLTGLPAASRNFMNNVVLVTARGSDSALRTKLYPAKVVHASTVHAIFAIE